MRSRLDRAVLGAKADLRHALGSARQARQQPRAARHGAVVRWSQRKGAAPRGNVLSGLKRLEAENADLRRQAVELALEIQELRARRL